MSLTLTDRQAFERFAHQQLAQDHTGHDWAHVNRVRRVAMQLCATDAAVDQGIVEAAALLHDCYDAKLVANVVAARQATQTLLAASQLAAGQQQQVLTIIDHLGYAANLEGRFQQPLAGQYVQDADRLDALGAVGIARTFYYGGAHQQPMYQPEVPPRTQMNEADYRQPAPVLNHFDEKLFQLAAMMNTEAGQSLAKTRTDYMREFVTRFKTEWGAD